MSLPVDDLRRKDEILLEEDLSAPSVSEDSTAPYLSAARKDCLISRDSRVISVISLRFLIMMAHAMTARLAGFN